MGYPTDVEGRIVISPPVTGKEIGLRPELFQEEALNPRGKSRSAWGDVESTHIDVDGDTLVKRQCSSIRAYEGDFSPWDLIPNVQEIVDAFPDREYTGYFECTGSDGDLWRIAVRDGKAVEIKPTITWPED